MRYIAILISSFLYPLTASAQNQSGRISRQLQTRYYDTIEVSTGISTTVKFVGDVNSAEIGGRSTSSKSAAGKSDLFYTLLDSENAIIFTALHPFIQPIPLTIFCDDTTVQALVVFRNRPATTLYTYNIGTSRPPPVPVINTSTPGSAAAGVAETKKIVHKDSAETASMDADLLLITQLEKNFKKGDVHRGKTIEVRKLYSHNKFIYLGISMNNDWKGSIQLETIDVELLHGNSGKKDVIHPIIESAGANNLNQFSKVDFTIAIPHFVTGYGDRLRLTFRPVKENNLPDYVIELTNPDFNKLKYVNEERDGKKKK